VLRVPPHLGRVPMSTLIRKALALFAPLFMLVSISCEQYEYASPGPGIIEVRLAVKNSRQDLIPFTAYDSTTGLQNIFNLRLKEVYITQPGDIRLELYSSLSARRRNPDGDAFNVLSTEARDSILLLGTAYCPPGTFTGLRFVMELLPPPRVVRTFGFYSSTIPVEELLPRVSLFTKNLSCEVREGRITRVTVQFDMDASLIQRAEHFDYRGNFSVSSVSSF